jgi:hypothetical protein
MNSQKLKGTIEFKVNEEKRSVVCVLIAHGKRFYGVAKCLEKDIFDVETGKVIAQMRATIKQRKFDLDLTREFIYTIKTQMETNLEFYGVASPHYMRSLQTAKEEEKAQLAHIRDLKRRINEFKLA